VGTIKLVFVSDGQSAIFTAIKLCAEVCVLASITQVRFYSYKATMKLPVLNREHSIPQIHSWVFTLFTKLWGFGFTRGHIPHNHILHPSNHCLALWTHNHIVGKLKCTGRIWTFFPSRHLKIVRMLKQNTN
jgi:hypothetical protein